MILFKGLFSVYSGHATKSLSKRIQIAQSALSEMKEYDTDLLRNPFFWIIKGGIACLTHKYEMSEQSLNKARLLVQKEDYFSIEIINYYLWQIYSPDYEKAMEIIKSGLKEKTFYWDYVIKHLNLLQETGRYDLLFKYAKRYLRKIPKKIVDNSYLEWKKCALLSYLCYCNIIFSNLQQFNQNLHQMKEIYSNTKSEQMKFVMEILILKYEIYWYYFYRKQYDLNNEYEIKHKSILKDADDYIYYLYNYNILPILIEYNLEKNNYEKSYEFISLFQRGREMGKKEERKLLFYYNYYIAKLMVRDPIEYKKWNVKHYSGTFLDIVIRYLEDAENFAKNIDIPTQILCFMEKANVLLMKKTTTISNPRKKFEYDRLYGFEQLYFLWAELVYEFLNNNDRKMIEVSKKLKKTLQKYKKYTIYDKWKEALEQILTANSLSNIIPNRAVNKNSLNLTNINSCIDFLQKEIMKSIAKS